jgi:hypothetical protein
MRQTFRNDASWSALGHHFCCFGMDFGSLFVDFDVVLGHPFAICDRNAAASQTSVFILKSYAKLARHKSGKELAKN